MFLSVLRVRRDHGDVGEERGHLAWRDAADAVGQDIRFALRHLLKSPGFTFIAVITLGLGIGANTSMFSVLNYYLLQPLPYANSAQLDRIYRATAQNPEGGVSPADFLDLQREMHGYGEIAACAPGDTSLSEPGGPAEMASAIRSTSNFFSELGIQPQLGPDGATSSASWPTSSPFCPTEAR